ncbi:MAG TPA: WD40 repeat domain-containing protein [Gemmataceae bacterium]|nr:WD40 repeat domain-containing protein [Gemmataceae bacterium]
MNRTYHIPIIGALLVIALFAGPGPAQDMNRQAGKFSLDGQATTVAMCSKYEYLAFGLKSGALSIFAVKEGKPVFANAWKGHDKAVTCMVFSADDKKVASGGMDGQIRLWDTAKSAEHAVTKELAAKAQPEHKIKAHTGGVYGLGFSPDGKRLASAGADGAIKVWNTATGELLFTFPAVHKGGARAVAYSPDGQSIVSGGMDKTVKIWEAKAGGKLIKSLDHPAPVYCVAVNVDGSRIASGTGLNDVQAHVILWDWNKGKEITDFKGHSDIVTGVVFHPTEDRLLSCSKDTTIRVWDLEKKEELYMDKHRDAVTGLSFAGDGKFFATASAEIIFLWQGTPKK